MAMDEDAIEDFREDELDVFNKEISRLVSFIANNDVKLPFAQKVEKSIRSYFADDLVINGTPFGFREDLYWIIEEIGAQLKKEDEDFYQTYELKIEKFKRQFKEMAPVRIQKAIEQIIRFHLDQSFKELQLKIPPSMAEMFDNLYKFHQSKWLSFLDSLFSVYGYLIMLLPCGEYVKEKFYEQLNKHLPVKIKNMTVDEEMILSVLEQVLSSYCSIFRYGLDKAVEIAKNDLNQE